MSMPLIAGCLWVLAATIVAFLPLRRQYPPGLTLLILAPVLLAWIAWAHGAWIFAVGLLAFLSMFRRPLFHILGKVFGHAVEESQ